MRIDLNARVITSDDVEVGTLKRVVVDPEINEVTGFVVGGGGVLGTGLFGKDVVVAVSELEHATADGDSLRLTLSKAEFDELPRFQATGYREPPADWSPPPNRPYPADSYLLPMPALPHVAPPDEPEPITRVEYPLGIAKGDRVMDLKEEPIGVVEDILIGDEGQIRGVIIRLDESVRKLARGGETIQIDGKVIEDFGDRVLHLRLMREDLGSLAG